MKKRGVFVQLREDIKDQKEMFEMWLKGILIFIFIYMGSIFFGLICGEMLAVTFSIFPMSSLK